MLEGALNSIVHCIFSHSDAIADEFYVEDFEQNRQLRQIKNKVKSMNPIVEGYS
jgi:hypothetical protein